MPFFTKADERDLLAKITDALESAKAPSSPDASYCVPALREFLKNWSDALDQDRPLECFRLAEHECAMMRQNAEAKVDRMVEDAKRTAAAILQAGHDSLARDKKHALETFRHAYTIFPHGGRLPPRVRAPEPPPLPPCWGVTSMDIIE